MLLVIGFAVGADASLLPRLGVSLKIEDVVVPVQSAAHALVKEFLGVLSASNGGGADGRIEVVVTTYNQLSAISTERRKMFHIPSVGQPVSPFQSLGFVVLPEIFWICEYAWARSSRYVALALLMS